MDSSAPDQPEGEDPGDQAAAIQENQNERVSGETTNGNHAGPRRIATIRFFNHTAATNGNGPPRRSERSAQVPDIFFEVETDVQANQPIDRVVRPTAVIEIPFTVDPTGPHYGASAGPVRFGPQTERRVNYGPGFAAPLHLMGAGRNDPFNPINFRRRRALDPPTNGVHVNTHGGPAVSGAMGGTVEPGQPPYNPADIPTRVVPDDPAFLRESESSIAKTEARVMQLNGRLLSFDDSCTACKLGWGPFEDCVVVDRVPGFEGFIQCANCHWDGHGELCSFVRAYNRQPLVSSELGLAVTDETLDNLNRQRHLDLDREVRRAAELQRLYGPGDTER